VCCYEQARVPEIGMQGLDKSTQVPIVLAGDTHVS
jgi:hypothetical protein